MRRSDCVVYFPALSCTRPLTDLWETPLKEVKDFCSAALGSRWRKTGWAEVQRASFLFAAERVLSPPSLQQAVVIAACDLFLAELSFFWRSFKCSSTLQPFHFKCLKRKSGSLWKEHQLNVARSVFELHVWFIVNITHNKWPAKQWIRFDKVWFLLHSAWHLCTLSTPAMVEWIRGVAIWDTLNILQSYNFPKKTCFAVSLCWHEAVEWKMYEICSKVMA